MQLMSTVIIRVWLQASFVIKVKVKVNIFLIYLTCSKLKVSCPLTPTAIPRDTQLRTPSNRSHMYMSHGSVH